jgi:hypothetical protein
VEDPGAAVAGEPEDRWDQAMDLLKVVDQSLLRMLRCQQVEYHDKFHVEAIALSAHPRFEAVLEVPV